MRRRRFLSLVLAVAAVSALAVGSGGFTSVSAERSVEVSVVENSEAYVGVQVCNKPSNKSQGNGTNPVRIHVTNRYREAFRVVAIYDDKGKHEINTVLETGQAWSYNGHATEPVAVEVTGDGLSANVTADVQPKNSC
ncbi:hypothetical protein [Halospeciosus flavus]|uniref:Uncharacterized protein n=1 Tax=Halospeciosus flavus TaxID=3032283 RepID=A0ABD5Z217_9EURY|nr:hypothetical protein [Halospeciosus flavus]